MNYVPSVVAVVALLGTVIAGGNEEKEPKVALMLLLAIIGTISSLIAFPNLLTMGSDMPGWELVAVAAIGAAIIGFLGRKGKLVGGILTVVGVGMMAWAGFRALPGGPNAFLYLGNAVAQAGTTLWDGVLGFIDRLKGGTQ